jgi:hypothetical protein
MSKKLVNFLLFTSLFFGSAIMVFADQKNPFVPDEQMVLESASYVQHFTPGSVYEAKLKKLVHDVSKGQAEYAGYFQGPGGLAGVLMKGPSSDSKTIVGWVPPGSDYILVGNLFDRSGNDLTLAANKAFLSLTSPVAPAEQEDNRVGQEGSPDIQKRVSGTELGIDGFDIEDPVATIYVFASPDCYHCRDMYRAVRKLEKEFVAAAVQVRWLLVGFDRSAIEKASALIASGIDTPWVHPAKKPTKESVQQVSENAQLLLDVVQGEKVPLPTVVWSLDGEEVVHPSSMDNKELLNLIETLVKPEA